ncbi:MAG: MBL fold metallo-hydrolase [Candidatus Xenobiia bacterium LiM19]
MNPQIITLTLKFVNVFLIKGERSILIDTGIPGSFDTISRAFRDNDIDPKSVSLIIVTHCHSDHIGDIARIKELTGARVAVHRLEGELLKNGRNAEVCGVGTIGKLLAFMLRFMNPDRLPGVEADILIDDELVLNDFGVEGRVIHTPGHTPGSVSVALDTGDIFTGDTLMKMSAKGKPRFSMFIVDMKESKKSLSRLLALSPRRLYPAHGAPCDPEDVRKLSE